MFLENFTEVSLLSYISQRKSKNFSPGSKTYLILTLSGLWWTRGWVQLTGDLVGFELEWLQFRERRSFIHLTLGSHGRCLAVDLSTAKELTEVKTGTKMGEVDYHEEAPASLSKFFQQKTTIASITNGSCCCCCCCCCCCRQTPCVGGSTW